MNCRHCGAPLAHVFLDLGVAPPSNAYLPADDPARPEKTYPLRVLVCDRCWLVQTEDHARADELFDAGYAYFSGTSTAWLAHARRYCEDVAQRLRLGTASFVIEVASNDGYLLRNFVAAGIPCLGIEPTAGTADAARKLGVPVLQAFFGERVARELAAQGRQADLVVGNNVFAHVPDIDDFARGLAAVLKPGGTVTLEFPHLLELIGQVQFDTVYHEHFSYLSLAVAERVLAAAGLRVFDVDTLATHGGSLRLWACHAGDARVTAASVDAVRERERAARLQDLATYRAFQARADRVTDEFLGFLREQKRAGRSVAAYGAAAKGNTLLNRAGVTPDLLPFVVDAAPSKQGRFMPGSRIPILAPSVLRERRPDFLLILPWNIADEVREQNADLARLGTRFVTAVPALVIT